MDKKDQYPEELVQYIKDRLREELNKALDDPDKYFDYVVE